MKISQTLTLPDFLDAYESCLHGVSAMPSIGDPFLKNHIILKNVDIVQILEKLRAWDVTEEMHFVSIFNFQDMLNGFATDDKTHRGYFEAF